MQPFGGGEEAPQTVATDRINTELPQANAEEAGDKMYEHERKFTYYGTQLIKRRTRDLKRSMVTTGYIESVPRTRNNPHGLMITNWRTLENKDLDY